MLQSIRDGLSRQKWLAWVVLGAIGATFIFWGGTNSLDFNGVSKDAAATVNGDEIPGKDTRRLAAGDVVRTETPGGGGYGR